MDRSTRSGSTNHNRNSDDEREAVDREATSHSDHGDFSESRLSFLSLVLLGGGHTTLTAGRPEEDQPHHQAIILHEEPPLEHNSVIQKALQVSTNIVARRSEGWNATGDVPNQL